MDLPSKRDADVSTRLRTLAQRANDFATECDDSIEVTLVVGGVVVTGILAAEERFTAWSQGVLRGSESTDATIPALGSQEIIDRRSEQARQTRARTIVTDTLFLHNAHILTSRAAGRFSFFLVRIDGVAAFSFGYRPPQTRKRKRGGR